MVHFTENGIEKKSRVKVGDIKKTLISVSRLNDCGYEAYLKRNRPCIVNTRTGEYTPLKRVNGMFVLTMWIWVPPKTDKGFQRQP